MPNGVGEASGLFCLLLTIFGCLYAVIVHKPKAMTSQVCLCYLGYDGFNN